jgi:uncharacterized protein
MESQQVEAASREDQVFSFVKESTKHFDSSHNHEHAWIVYQNALTIMASLEPAFDKDFLLHAALLHDVCDHKYPQSIPRAELDAFIVAQLGAERGHECIFLIDMVSFSKEDKVRRGLADPTPVPEHLKLYLDALRDADRLEAIGQIGIDRCIAYSESIGRKIPEDVIVHCHEKLLRLYEEKFIVTEKGRELAAPLHQVIVDYVKAHEQVVATA